MRFHSSSDVSQNYSASICRVKYWNKDEYTLILLGLLDPEHNCNPLKNQETPAHPTHNT